MRGRLGVNRLEGELCWNFTVVFALWLPQGMAGERGVEGGGGTVRAYCVDIWREFSINEKRTARCGAAKAMGAAVLVQHATQRKLHTGLCVCQMVPRGMCNGGQGEVDRRGLGHIPTALSTANDARWACRRSSHTARGIKNSRIGQQKKEKEREYVQ